MSIGFVDVEEVIHLTDGKRYRGFFVVVSHHFDVVDDHIEEVRLLCIDTGCLVPKVREVDVEMVERRLVVEVYAQLAAQNLVLVEYSFLKQKMQGISIDYFCEQW